MPYTENYSDDIQPAFPGMVADTGLAVIVSRTVDTAAIPFGTVAVVGPRDHTVTPIQNNQANRIEGIAVRTQTIRAEPGLADDAYPLDDTAAILKEGVIWVTVSAAVTRGEAATVTTATGAISSAAVAAGIVAIPGGVFETSAGANGLARMRIS